MAIGRLGNGLTWRIGDAGMGLLERAGLAALYMSLKAAEEQNAAEGLHPLKWNLGDLASDSVTLRSEGTDKEALTKLFEWAWQVREDILYFPAIHRDAKARDNSHLRAGVHNGILRTFLQHTRVQPKGTLIERLVELEEGRQEKIAYQVLATEKLKPLLDLGNAKFFGKSGILGEKPVGLSGWVFPGIAPRFKNERAWSGPPHLGLLLMLAPIVCWYLQLHNQRSTWLFVVPDVNDLEEFDTVISMVNLSLDPAFRDVASLGDAGLRFLGEFASQKPRRELQSGCRVVAMGKVKYYNPNQSVRRGVVDVAASAKVIRRYLRLQQVMGNRWMRRKAIGDDEKKVPARGKKAAKREEPLQATHFVSVPNGRGRIADNLIAGRPWYSSLAEPLPWDHDALDRLRKRRPGASVERLWFQNLSYQRGNLMELIQAEEMWDNSDERLFVEAFWEVLAALYKREADAVERGGSRNWQDRCEDLNEEIRRELSRSKTGPLLRTAVADIFSRPVAKFRSKSVRANPGVIWRLIDRDWKRGRDLALLALASYQSKEKRVTASNETQSDKEQ